MTLTRAQHLQPPNAVPDEKALAAGLNRDAVLGPSIDAIAGWRFARPLPAGFGPWLVKEYQLGAIRRFFAIDEDCIDAGWPWQRLRGTLTAVDRAMGWIGYDAAMVEPPQVRRRNWHRWQQAMGELPLDETGEPGEDPRLYDAEFLAGLSDPARSVFVRGHHGYDVRALQLGDGRWGDTIWGDDSGVRMDGGTAKWSHGRTHGPFEATAGAVTQSALGIDTLAAGTIDWSSPLTWDQVGHLNWLDPTPEQIAELIATIVAGLSIYVGFFDADGEMIGARRAIERKPATTFGGQPIAADQTVLEVTCRTGFGDGQGSTAASCAVLFDVQSTRGPGDLWVPPEFLEAPDGVALADITVGAWPFALTFAHTIREHLTMRVRLL
ncbi:MAG: phage tail protein [Pseudomonadota bacterium]